MKKKVVLAYSGGLDTTYCVKYLTEEKGLDVYAITVNTGGFSAEELKGIQSRIYQLGVKEYIVQDVEQEYFDQCLRYLIFGNVLKNNTYPLSVSAERAFQAMAAAQYAREIKADYVAHGSTGAGNDQVRFDMIFNIIVPEAGIITPIRDQKLSRKEEIDYLHQFGVDMDSEKAKYSVNKGIWGTSVGGVETLTSRHGLPESAWPTHAERTESRTIAIEFDKGVPARLDGITYSHPVELVRMLNQVAGPYGIGRDIHVGDTIIGIKGRVGFEAAAPIILIKAHHLLEKHVLTKQQLFWKDQLSQPYGNFLHEGLFFDPVMRDFEAFLESSQENVTGTVFVKLFPYRFELEGIDSKFDLMSDRFGSYGEMNRAWTGEDVRGFARIFSNQMMMYHKVKEANESD